MSAPLERLNAALAGHYRLARELGAGGMATVYLAEDQKHDRKVAIKVLKPELAAVLGADRFVQEIKTTASLTHPHILPLFDSGEADGFLYYVMPYLEGETIREKLNRETQFAVADAVRITTEVADALEYAHRHGVIHRDIKPENILLHEGRPMVMDFGIALAVSAAAGGRMTETGLSLGTPHYMSPEQATAAKSITARSDIYSLGCVLYEMLAGEPPHTGPTAQAIIMKIVAEPVPDVMTQRQSVPANVSAALAKALERLPADRFESAKAFADALANPVFSTVPARAPETAGLDARGVRSWIRSPLSWAALATLLVVAAVPQLRREPAGAGVREVIRFAVPVLPDDGPQVPTPFPRGWVTELAISPDGGRLVYTALSSALSPDAGSWLYQRRMGQDQPEVLLAGSSTLRYDRRFFSPDGAWVGFVAWGADGGTLRRLRLADGVTETIGTLTEFPGVLTGNSAGTGFTGPVWCDDGTIVIATRNALYRIPASGGEWLKVAETPSDSGSRAVWSQPHVLPGSRVALLHAARSLRPEDADIIAVDLATGAQRIVIANAMNPLYLHSGILLFVREGVLMGIPFDLEQTATMGQPVALVEDVMQAVGMTYVAHETGAAQVAVSSTGALAFARGGIRQPRRQRVVRVTSRGDTIPIGIESRDWLLFRLSPDANRLAAVSRRGHRHEIWIHDLKRGVTRNLQTGGDWNWPLEWSPDGRWILFTSDRERDSYTGLYRMPADGSALPEPLVPASASRAISKTAGSWSSEGVIAYLGGSFGREDIWVIPPDSPASPFVSSDSLDYYPTFSPDGRWLAYASNQSGRFEVYVRPYPAREPVTQVSTGGGWQPAWARDGRTLYYSANGAIMAVDVAAGPDFRPGLVRRVIPWNDYGFTPVRRYDVFPDGSFVDAALDPAAPPPPRGVSELQVILNFSALVAERVGREK